MRRSSAVKLTLLPMLASAAVAAQPAAEDEPMLSPPGETEPMQPPGETEPMQPPGETAPLPPGETEPLRPPGGTEPMLSPPGLTPTIDACLEDPDDPRCPPVDEPDPIGVYGGYVHGGVWGHAHGRFHHCVFRGGFGHYFWAAGG